MFYFKLTINLIINYSTNFYIYLCWYNSALHLFIRTKISWFNLFPPILIKPQDLSPRITAIINDEHGKSQKVTHYSRILTRFHQLRYTTTFYHFIRLSRSFFTWYSFLSIAETRRDVRGGEALVILEKQLHRETLKRENCVLYLLTPSSLFHPWYMFVASRV